MFAQKENPQRAAATSPANRNSAQFEVEDDYGGTWMWAHFLVAVAIFDAFMFRNILMPQLFASSFCFVAFSRENRLRVQAAQMNRLARKARRALFPKTL